MLIFLDYSVMAKFLNTRQCAAELTDLIMNGTEELVLISPYLHLPKDFKDRLKLRDDKGKKTVFIILEQKLNTEETTYLASLKHTRLKCNEGLHAKCYLSGNKMIITSMNFYEFSIEHNKEMGVLIDRAEPADTKLFKEAFTEVEFIINTSQDYPSGDRGYCIRTGMKIPFNIKRPLSQEAYKKWSEYSNPDYPEKYCHFSGEPSNGETSVNKPVMTKNWYKAKEIYGL